MLEPLHDPIYGKLELPATARKLATSCPLILRLREVRMPNTPFITYPSFSGVSRYEHSLGVAHLTWWWAQQNNLPQQAAETLTLGALYHDAATPAFSHLFEEFLSRNSFDHEHALADILSARPGVAGGAYSQVFVGRSPRLRDELAKRSSDEPVITASEVSAIAVGKDPLGRIVHGDIDLDNIDNVIRAVTAMGIDTRGPIPHPYEIASALILENGKIALAPAGRSLVGRWQELRRILYHSILDSQEEFLMQATIKWSIEECYRQDRRLEGNDAWFLTEPELIFNHLRAVPRSRQLIDRARLADPAPLLFSAWIEDLRPLMGPGSDIVTVEISNALRKIWRTDAYISVVRDKRERAVDLQMASPQTLFDMDPESAPIPAAPVQASDWSGLLGAVGLRLDAAEDYGGRPATDAALAKTRSLLQNAFALNVQIISGRWLGTTGAKR